MNRTRLTLTAATAATAAALLSGCAAGQDAATLQVHPNFASGNTNGILAQNIVVVVDPTTKAAQLTGTVVNTTEANDQLTSITIGGTPVTAPLPVSVDAKGALNLATANGTKFVAKGTGATAGINTTVDLKFATGGDLQLSAAVQTNTGDYAAYQPSAPATAS